MGVLPRGGGGGVSAGLLFVWSRKWNIILNWDQWPDGSNTMLICINI